MSDLLTDSQVAAFKAAMRDVTDTFHKYPVSVDMGAGPVDLLCGRKILEGEFNPGPAGEEISERFLLSFNREYLAERGLVDGDDKLLLGYDDEWYVSGKRYFVLKSKEDAVFRESKMMVFVEVVR